MPRYCSLERLNTTQANEKKEKTEKLSGCSTTRSSLKDFKQDCPLASHPGLEPPPISLFLTPLTNDVRARTAKMRGRIWTRPEWVLLDTHDFHASMHSQPHTFSAEQVSAHCQKNFRVFCPQVGIRLSRAPKYARCSAKAPPCRVRRHMFFCALAGGFCVRPFLKSTNTDFGGVGLVLAVLERPCGRW